MKSKDDFSQAQLRTFHGRLSKAATKEDRAVVFKEIGALPQAVGQWFRHMGLAPLGAPGETNAKPKAGGKGKAKIAATGKKAGRPKGSKNSPQAPHLSVEGTIELERLVDVLHVAKPVQGQERSTTGLFKIVNGGKEAIRVPVKLGRSSVSTIEILDGLQPGDQIILSDMSPWDAHNRVRLR